LRHSLRLWVLGATVVAAGSSCGDDDPPPRQAVIWFGLSTGLGQTCSSAQTFTIPDGAIPTITGQTGVGDRVTDSGGDLVDCSITPSAAEGSYNVSLSYSNPANQVGNLSVSGALSNMATGNVTISFTSTAFSLSNPVTQPCTARVKVLDPNGAIWIDQLSCPNLVEASSPGISCVGSGGLIFENCG
jgi:hypothetical protein